MDEGEFPTGCPDPSRSLAQPTIRIHNSDTSNCQRIVFLSLIGSEYAIRQELDCMGGSTWHGRPARVFDQGVIGDWRLEIECAVCIALQSPISNFHSPIPDHGRAA